MVSLLPALQDWYNARCDGDREHRYGIGTTDNPGWRLSIDLEGTALQEVVQRPEVLRNALHVYQQSRLQPGDVTATRREITALDRALEELKGEEAHTVQPQIADITAGASPDAYAEAFAQFAVRRKDIQDRRGLLRRSDAGVQTTPIPVGWMSCSCRGYSMTRVPTPILVF